MCHRSRHHGHCANCPLPLGFTATVNDHGTITLTSTSRSTPATAYSPYYEAMTNKLNQAFPVGDNPFRPLRPTPNEVDLAIHGTLYKFLPDNTDNLYTQLSESIRNATGVTIFSARFLQRDTAKRKDSGSVVVTVTPDDVGVIGLKINLFSQLRNVQRLYRANKTDICRFCSKFGHTAPACKATHPIYPLCSLAHRRSEHRCPNPTCPKEGNLNAVPDYCPSSTLLCPHCNGPHAANFKNCPSHPIPQANPPTAAGPNPMVAGDPMDSSDDAPAPRGAETPPQPPRRALFDSLVTPYPAQVATPSAPRPRPLVQMPDWTGDHLPDSPEEEI